MVIGARYCTAEDLREAYGEERVEGWSRLNSGTVERAITDASAEIDGYLLSGGYDVPLAGHHANLKKYSIDIAAANLVIGCGVLAQDPGGEAVIEHAKIARRYLEKVAEGKFKIPGYALEDEPEIPPAENIRVSARPKLDLRGF